VSRNRCTVCRLRTAARKRSGLIRFLASRSTLLCCQPIPNLYAKFLGALYAPNSSCKIRAHKSGVSYFIGEPTHGCEPEIDGGGDVMSLFERNAVPSNYGLVESQPGFGAVPFDKFANGVIVGALRTLEVRLLRTADFDCSRSGSFKTVFGVRLRLFFAISAVCTIGRCGTPVTARLQYAAVFLGLYSRDSLGAESNLISGSERSQSPMPGTRVCARRALMTCKHAIPGLRKGHVNLYSSFTYS